MTARIWALVIDPMHARVLRGFESGDGEEPIEFVSHAPATRLRAILSGAVLGTKSDGHDTQGAAPAPIDAEELREDTDEFLRETLSFLETQHRAHRFERLAVFADPAILTSVRTQLSAQLKDGLILHPARRLMTLAQDTLHRRLRDLIDQSDKQGGAGPRNQGSD
ncbi:host attachment protein [Roseicyclus sp.]|uniref:host attachment protein n=1 Tax=Roseicyclus sp. TaxID=1914329 RepID=UPI003F6AE665